MYSISPCSYSVKERIYVFFFPTWLPIKIMGISIIHFEKKNYIYLNYNLIVESGTQDVSTKYQPLLSSCKCFPKKNPSTLERILFHCFETINVTYVDLEEPSFSIYPKLYGMICNLNTNKITINATTSAITSNGSRSFFFFFF